MKIISYATQRPSKGLGYVYKWTNLINGMMYIGSHCGSNPKYIASGQRINRAIRKHGLENFNREILYTGPKFREVEGEILDTINAACKGNMFYNDMNGYSPGSINWVTPEEVRRKISEAGKGRIPSTETRLKMSLSHAGENNHFYGKTHTDETKAKISAAGKGRVDSEETRRKKSESLKGKPTSKVQQLKASFTRHIQNHIEKTPKRKYTCRWCNGDTLEQAIKDATKEVE